MADVVIIFSIAGAIMVIGFLANLLFRKTGFPDTLFLIVIGIVLGPISGIFLREEMLSVTPFFATLTLMIILFEGGLNIEIRQVISQSFRAAILGFLHVLMATVFVSVFSYYVLGLGWVEALMLGPMTAGTSSDVIIPLLPKLNVNEETRVTLSIESTIADVLNIVLVVTFLQMYLGGLMDLRQTASAIVARFAVGIVLGFMVGLLWIKILTIIRRQEYNYILTTAVLAFCYAGSEFLGGSGSIAALLFGLAIGNHETLSRISGGRAEDMSVTETINTVKKFQGEIAFLVRAFFFVVLGLIYMPYWLGSIYAIVIVAVNLGFRYVAVTISTFKSGMRQHRRFMTLMCGTGLANATLSVLVYATLASLNISSAYLYPLIIANTIIINNILSALAVLMKR